MRTAGVLERAATGESWKHCRVKAATPSYCFDAPRREPMPARCFVVMGFGEKPDIATGRTLDLDKSYRLIIKRAVEDAGLECIRADEVIHAGIIDKPMYELLLDADVVVADLST